MPVNIYFSIFISYLQEIFYIICQQDKQINGRYVFLNKRNINRYLENWHQEKYLYLEVYSEREVMVFNATFNNISVISWRSTGWKRKKLYDKRDYFNFRIVTLPFICSNISAALAYEVYISKSSLQKS